jgi:flagellar protein FlbD
VVEVHRLNGELFLLNSDMIETVEITPDTVIRLVNGHRYVVRESFDDIKNAIVVFRRRAGYSCIPFGISPDSEGSQS